MRWSRERHDAEERRHQESIEVSREIEQRVSEGAEIAKESNRGQAKAFRVGTTLAVITILVSVVLYIQPWHSDPAPVQAPAVVQLTPARDAVIPKTISGLSAPPGYPPSQSANHCTEWWQKWFGQQAAAPIDNHNIMISAPQDADATVVSASIKVYRSYKPADLTFIECMRGAGVIPGTFLNVNLTRPNDYPTIVSDSGQLTPLAMPSAVINIDPGHTENISVQPDGRQGVMYSWSIQLVVMVNQKQKTYYIGSVAHPLYSWFGSIPHNPYDYDMQTHSWRLQN